MAECHDVTAVTVDNSAPAHKSVGQALLERLLADNLKLAAVAVRMDEVKASIGVATALPHRERPTGSAVQVTVFFEALRKLVEDHERLTAKIAADVEDIASGF